MPIFMKIDGIDGEVAVEGYERWMEVFSYSFGVTMPISPSGGGGGATRAAFSDLTVVKPTSKGSPTILLHLCNGRHIPQVRINFVRAGSGHGGQVYLAYVLEDVVFTGYQAGADAGGAIPTESVSIAFAKIQYIQAVPDGIEEMYWDLRSNRGGGGQ